MQDVGENMDELFRKAADHYMLKEGESNWEKISNRLQPSVAPVTLSKKTNATKKYIIAGVFLLICVVAAFLYNHYTWKNITPVISTSKHQHNNAVNDNVVENAVPPGHEALRQNEVVNKESDESNRSTLNKNINTGIKKTGDVIYRSYLTETTSFNKHQVDVVPNKHPVTELNISPATKNKIENISATASKTQTSLDARTVRPGLIKDSTEMAAKLKLSVKNKRGLYYGLLAGAGFTTVKGQGFSKPGFDVGVVAGYQFASKSSVEISVSYTNKYYYSDGKYFKMDKMTDMPSDMKLMSVESNSSIFEILVKFKYDVLQQKNSAIYATAGITSYILVNEKNDYVTSTNGTMGNMNGTYKKTSGYVAGAVHISAGYQHTIGRNNIIRFEPYITIPAKGIGMGSLPVTTSGIHVLFTIAPHK